MRAWFDADLPQLDKEGSSKKKKKKKRRKKGEMLYDEDTARRGTRMIISGFSNKDEIERAKEAMAPKDDLPVKELKDMPPVQAIRHALLHRAGNLNAVFDIMDKDGGGSLDEEEFIAGLQELCIPWKEITGASSVHELFSYFDESGDGEVELDEFLGYPEAMVSDWRKLDHQGLWKNYVTKVMMTSLVITRDAKWDKVMEDARLKAIERNMNRDVDGERFALVNAIKKSMLQHPAIKKFKIGYQDEGEIMRVRRTQTSHFNDKRRKMESRLKDVAFQKSEVQKLYKTLYEAQNPDVDQEAARQASEKAKKQQKWDGMSRQKNQHGDDSYALMGKKPLGKDLINAFNEESLLERGDLTEDDIQTREVARSLGISFPEIEKVKKVFDKYDEDGSGQMEKDEFDCMMNDLICVGKLKGQEVPKALLDSQWKGVDHDGSGEVDFDEFCEWYFFAYKPMMAEMEAKGARHSAEALKKNSQNY